MELCREYGMHILFHLASGEAVSGAAPMLSGPNAFQILMQSSRERVLPQKTPEGDQIRGNQKLLNDVIAVLENKNIAWSPQSGSSIGESSVNQLTSVLWYLDPHHDTLQERGLRIHKELSHLSGYNDWQRKKIKKPQLSASGLDGYIESLSRLVSQPWLARAEYSLLRALCDSCVM